MAKSTLVYIITYQSTLPKKKLTFSFCLESISLINEKIVPKLNELKNHPLEKNNVLIDKTLKNEITLYLRKVKDMYDDVHSKKIIDHLIATTNDLADKPNAYITDYLEK